MRALAVLVAGTAAAAVLPCAALLCPSSALCCPDPGTAGLGLALASSNARNLRWQEPQSWRRSSQLCAH
eukprot:12624334-Heterocapsa_arctica.AAC.1